LTPTFELSRSQRLPFALKDPLESDTVSWVTWDEAENPYETLVQHLDELYRTKARDVVASSHGVQEGDQADKSTSSWSIHLEENVRQFVASGLEDAAAAKTASLTGAREDTITKDNVHPGIRVAMADPRVRQQRMRKTDAELSIQRCAAKVSHAPAQARVFL
jgi:MoxR-like ATPase